MISLLWARQSELTDDGTPECDVSSKAIGTFIRIGVDGSIMSALT